MKELNLPACEDIERLVLGSIMLDSQFLDSMRTTLDVSDFAGEKHQSIWRACCEAFDGGGSVDRVVIYQALDRAGNAGQGIGKVELGYLCELDNGLPILPSLDRYVEMLKEKSLARRGMQLCHNAMLRFSSGTAAPEDVHESLLAELQGLGAASGDRRPVSTRDMVDKIGVDGVLNPKRSKEGIRMPWGKLQDAVGGFRAGQMIVAAAYTSRGKTSLACQIATHATRQATGVMYWTTEMAPIALFRRMIDQMGNIDGLRHRESALLPMEMNSARESVGWLYDHPVWFDQSSRTVPSFLGSIRHAKQKQDIGLVVVDHIQHVRGVGRYGSRAQEVSEVSRSLKMAALDLDIPFLVLSQVSRPKEDNADLTIHAIKESGDVENDADVVMLLNSAKPQGLTPVAVNLKIAKQREGPAGFDVPLVFYPASQRFDSSEEEG